MIDAIPSGSRLPSLVDAAPNLVFVRVAGGLLVRGLRTSRLTTPAQMLLCGMKWLVAQIFTSSNPVISWLRQIMCFKSAV